MHRKRLIESVTGTTSHDRHRGREGLAGDVLAMTVRERARRREQMIKNINSMLVIKTGVGA
jgi:hypothetical protein